MIDWAGLVLAPAMAVFGQPITVTPTKSQPKAAPYAACGVYACKPVQEVIEGTELVHQTHQHTLGIRLPDYPVPPAQGDGLAMPQGSFLVTNVEADGQGGGTLILRKL